MKGRDTHHAVVGDVPEVPMDEFGVAAEHSVTARVVCELLVIAAVIACVAAVAWYAVEWLTGGAA